MKKIFLYILVIMFSVFPSCGLCDENQYSEGIVQSAENKTEAKAAKHVDKNIKNERKQILKKRKKYLKNISKIEKMEEKQRQNIRELNFLKERLQIKENKLKMFTEEEKNEKGENEE